MRFIVLGALALGACATPVPVTDQSTSAASGDTCAVVARYDSVPQRDWNTLCSVAWDEFEECRPKLGFSGMDCVIEYSPADEYNDLFAELFCEREISEVEPAPGEPSAATLLAETIAACGSVVTSRRHADDEYSFVLSSGLELEVLEAYAGNIELAIYDPD